MSTSGPAAIYIVILTSGRHDARALVRIVKVGADNASLASVSEIAKMQWKIVGDVQSGGRMAS